MRTRMRARIRARVPAPARCLPPGARQSSAAISIPSALRWTRRCSRSARASRETDRKADGGRIGAALRRLNTADRSFARAVLNGRTWRDSGMTKQGFNKRLKKFAILFHPDKHWVKSHFLDGAEGGFSFRPPPFADCL